MDNIKIYELDEKYVDYLAPNARNNRMMYSGHYIITDFIFAVLQVVFLMRQFRQ